MKHWQYWLLNALAVLVLILVSINIVLFMDNRTVQLEVAKQQQFINQSIRLSRLNAQLIRALATASVQNDDPAIRALLNSHGVTYSVNNPDNGDQ